MTTPDNPLVIQTEHLDAAAGAWLAQRCRLERCPSDDARFGPLLAQAQALVIRTYTQIDAALLAQAPRLKVVGRAGVGLDNVDLAACRAAGVRVVSTPDANTRAVVEFVLALLADATRPRLFLGEAIDAKRWKELREELKAARQICEMTVGVWGMGRVGSAVARALTAIDAKVLYHDLLEVPHERRFGATPVSRDELLASSDVVTLHVDGRPENRGLVGADALSKMKNNVLLLNTSRGLVIDNLALADFMIAHPMALAMLDVHEPEPFDDTYPLLDISNVHLSPHIASATVLANRNMSLVVHDVWRVLSGEPPKFPAV